MTNTTINRRIARKCMRGGCMALVPSFCEFCENLLPSTRTFQHFNFYNSENCAIIVTIRDWIVDYCPDTEPPYLRSYDTFAYCIIARPHRSYDKSSRLLRHRSTNQPTSQREQSLIQRRRRERGAERKSYGTVKRLHVHKLSLRNASNKNLRLGRLPRSN